MRPPPSPSPATSGRQGSASAFRALSSLLASASMRAGTRAARGGAAADGRVYHAVQGDRSDARTVSCPSCARAVSEKRACLYCGALLTTASTAPATLLGMNASQWLDEARRVGQLRQYERALACLDKALQIEPSRYPEAWFSRALLLVELGRPHDSVACLDQAIVLDPSFTEAIELRARIRGDRSFPPGRPARPLLEGLALGDDAAAYALTAIAALFRELGRLRGPEEIAAVNWIVTVPRTRGDAADGEVLLHLIGRDKSAYAFHHAGHAPELPDALLPQRELEAYAALLSSATVSSLGLCCNRPFTRATGARVAALNDGLAKIGIAPRARMELLVIDDGVGSHMDVLGLRSLHP